jgi:hypothetical protein
LKRSHSSARSPHHAGPHGGRGGAQANACSLRRRGDRKR